LLSYINIKITVYINVVHCSKVKPIYKFKKIRFNISLRFKESDFQNLNIYLEYFIVLILNFNISEKSYFEKEINNYFLN